MSQSTLPIDITGADLRLKVAIENHRQGNLDRAEALYTVILRADPDFPDALNLLARLKLERGAIDEGLALIGRALEVKPGVADYYLTAGVLLGRAGRNGDAMAHLNLAGELDANGAQPELQKGVLHQAAGDWAGALRHYQRAVDLDPDCADGHNNAGVALRHLRRIPEAETALHQALAIDGDHVSASANLSLLLTDFGDLDEAVRWARHATSLDGENVIAWTNLGTALYAQGETEGAAASFRKALSLDDTCIEAHANLGMALLALGEYDDGWREYEWRWQRDDMLRYHREFGVPQWDGAPLDGRTVLVHAEQGAGDTLQGLRYIPLIKARGGRVILDVQAPLVGLLDGWADVAGIIRHGQDVPSVDFHAPVMSLPYLFKTTQADIPPDPVLPAPSDELIFTWKQRLPRASGMRIGLCWQGNPEFVWDRWRSIPLAEFVPLFKVPGCSFVSVHKGTGEGQIDQLGLDNVLCNPSAHMASFADTAAIMKNLDLIITSCTSVAHLAGVLGLPVWLVLSAAPDWRWLRDRDDTPWYPSMRLFRQKRLGDWTGVLNQVAAQLAMVQSGAATVHDFGPING